MTETYYTEYKELVDNLRTHVRARGGTKIENGAWQMMLDAADAIEELKNILEDIKQACLIADTDGITVTTEPHIDEELFERICEATKK